MRALYQLSYLMSKKQDVQDLKLDLIIRHLNVGSGEVQALEKATKDIMASGPSGIKQGAASAETEHMLECGWPTRVDSASNPLVDELVWKGLDAHMDAQTKETVEMTPVRPEGCYSTDC